MLLAAKQSRLRLRVLVALPIIWATSISAAAPDNQSEFCVQLKFGTSNIGVQDKEAVKERLIFLLDQVRYKTGSTLRFSRELTCAKPMAEFIVSKAKLAPNNSAVISYESDLVIRNYDVFLQSESPSTTIQMGDAKIRDIKLNSPDYIISSALWISFSKKNNISNSPKIERMRNEICKLSTHSGPVFFSKDVVDC